MEACFAVSKNFGIGVNNKIPWHIPEDLEFFKRLTLNNVIIMGKNTWRSLPKRPLSNRINIIITNTIPTEQYPTNVIFTSLENLQNHLSIFPHLKHIFIGGAHLFHSLQQYIHTIHITYIDSVVECDVFLPKISNHFFLSEFSTNYYSESLKCNFRFLKFLKSSPILHDETYLDLANKIIHTKSNIRIDRTNTGTLSLFGDQIQFDISKSVPVLTTKRIPWKSCIEELLWFLRGDTNAQNLKNKNVNIWNGNSSRSFLDNVGLNHLKEGDCGANYSFQWRFFGQTYQNSESSYEMYTSDDQINNVYNLLLNDPYSRRIFLSAWNPSDLSKTVLPPCHVSAQFYVDHENGLSCHMYQRSCDVFLGLPWNILSYSILTYILAKKCNMSPKKLIISFGDVHIYSNHIDQMKTQLSRNHLAYPVLELNDSIIDTNFEDLTIDQFDLVGYFPHPSIKGVMSV